MVDLPENLEAEQGVLGTILASNAAFHEVSEFLRAEHFANGLHAKIYDIVSALIGRGQVASVVTLKTYLEHDEALTAAGGMAYLVDLMAASVHPLDAEQYGRAVLDVWRRRQLIEITERTAAAARRPNADHDVLTEIEGIERELGDLVVHGHVGQVRTFDAVVRDALGAAEGAFRRGDRVTGLRTGFDGLDDLLGGLHRTDLVVIAGRPSAGKTALATNIAAQVAASHRTETDADGRPVTVDGAPVGFFSLEMSGVQLGSRIIAGQAGIPANRIQRGLASGAEMDRYMAAAEEVQALPLIIDESSSLSIAALRARARRLKRLHGLGLIVVDYLQIIEGSTRKDGRVQEVSEITRGLKMLAKELDLPVIALSQLSRKVEDRPDKRPQLSDLRDSGSIEQDADVVMFVYREEYYLERSDKRGSQEHINSMGRAEVIVAKQRNGATGTITLSFDAALAKFSDPVTPAYQEAA